MTYSSASPSYPTNTPVVLTVSQFSRALKQTIETTFSGIGIRGEITGLKKHTSGHVYFSLKEGDTLLSAVCWRGTVSSGSVILEEGLEIIASGRLTTYPGRSQYQLIVEKTQVFGEGSLLKLLQERKERLRAEGLFGQEHKRSLPFIPNTIGIITSPTGAVIQDILHRLRARFPRHVLLWPVAVQGEGAPPSIIRALRGFESLTASSPIPRPDVIIIARGGGSIEDLWAFNDEALIREVFSCTIPVISAIGHETDTSLLDFVSDLRAPTPTGAAEMVVPVRQDLFEALLEKQRLLVLHSHHVLQRAHLTFAKTNDKLKNPLRLFEPKVQRLDDLTDALRSGLQKKLSLLRISLLTTLQRFRFPLNRIHEGNSYAQSLLDRVLRALRQRIQVVELTLKQQHLLLEAASYSKILRKGFALVKDAHTSKPILRASTLLDQGPTSILIEFIDAEVGAITSSDTI